MKRMLTAVLYAALLGAALTARGADVRCWGEVLYASGGVGVDGREDLLLSLPDPNLRVTTAALRSGAFLAGVVLEIVDDCGVVRVQTTLDGPILVAKLPPGRYQLRADFGGKRQTRLITIPEKGTRSEHFYWVDTSATTRRSMGG